MKYLLVLFALSTIYQAHAKPSWLGPLGLIGSAAPGIVLKGPSAATSLLGPDGSAITASAIGGTVAAGPALGGVVSAPLLTPTVLAAPALAAPAGAVLAGPSGTVISSPWGAPVIAGPSKVLGGWIG
ncbi:uncharacterized protein [Euwallacea similis]|uniref:uncharacterized protein n=1 Tax=Euwallacea similis TaxID=1736056 RepID=UPI00344B047E